jgi:hypothetical protein
MYEYVKNGILYVFDAEQAQISNACLHRAMDGSTLNLCLSEVDVSTDRLYRPLSWPL